MADLSQVNSNPNRKLYIIVNGIKYARYPIKTELITPKHNIIKVVVRAVKDLVEKGDIIVFSEKATAISQGRAYHKDDVNPSWLAKFLVKYVTKSDRGIGISSPETFQLAIEECGYLRIILASLIGGLGKLVGIKGLFYYIAGNGARLIDGAAEYVMPPYNKYVSKGPANSNKITEEISQQLNVRSAIIDINDYGGVIVGSCKAISKSQKKLLIKILKDNPLGQSSESTPIGIIRKEE